MGKARFIKWTGVTVSSAVGLIVIVLLPKSHINGFEWDSGTNGRYLSEKGFIITEQDSPIWGQEFERYQKIQNRNPKIEKISSSEELKGRCKEYLSQLNNKSKIVNNNIRKMSPWEFVRLFCAGKTPLSIFLRGMENSPRRLSVSKNDNRAWGKIAKLLQGRNGVSEENAIKDFCKKTNWSSQMRLINDLGFTIAGCTNQLLKR